MLTVHDRTIALDVARILLDIRAINISHEQPFTLTSGRKSPVYIDCRKIISFPAERRKIIDYAVHILKTAGALEKTDMIAGGETAGIAYAAWIAERLELPMLYVRKKPKGFGRMAQIEGEMDKNGCRVLLVEDLATDGGSKIAFCNVLRQAGAVVSDAFSIFYYGIYPNSREMMKEAGLRLHFLTTWWQVLEVAKEKNSFSKEALRALEEFLAAPDSWSEGHSASMPSAGEGRKGLS